MQTRHIISAQQFDKQFINIIFKKATLLETETRTSSLKGKIMASLFYEPSTRTRLSFESAMQRLGGEVISTENAAEFSSAAKGETLEDTIRVVNSFADLIVLRHFTEGASEIASKYSNVPIVNAGDGKGEHPTQALLDLYTIFSHFKVNETSKLTVVMVGDLKNGRTIHSLTHLLSMYSNFKLIYVSPKALALPKDFKDLLTERKINFTETENLSEVLKVSDVIYQTRIQKERFVNERTGESEYLKYFGKYILNKQTLKMINKDSIIMHPLPRVNEITADVDQDKRAMYFQQVQNGLFVRMALLLYLFDKNL